MAVNKNEKSLNNFTFSLFVKSEKGETMFFIQFIL